MVAAAPGSLVNMFVHRLMNMVNFPSSNKLAPAKYVNIAIPKGIPELAWVTNLWTCFLGKPPHAGRAVLGD